MNSGEGNKVSGKAYDPICGVRVESGEGVPSSEYKKRRYFFCSDKCKHEFERAAERIRMQEAATLTQQRFGMFGFAVARVTVEGRRRCRATP